MALQTRMEKALERGHLSVAELGLWLGRPMNTVYSWLHGANPRAAWLDEIERRLSVLEVLAKRGDILPYDIPWKDRSTYLVRLRDAHIPRPRAVKARV